MADTKLAPAFKHGAYSGLRLLPAKIKRPSKSCVLTLSPNSLQWVVWKRISSRRWRA